MATASNASAQADLDECFTAFDGRALALVATGQQPLGRAGEVRR